MTAYTEVELEHSMQTEIDAITEWKRFCTNASESKLQKGLIPVWLDFAWHVPEDHIYFKNEDYVVSRNPYETIIKFQKEGFANKLFVNEEENRFIDGNMQDFYDEGKVYPFLTFINGYFIPWDKLTLVKSDTYITFIINRDRDIPVKSVRILSIPFKLNYNTINRDPAYGMKLFSFNNDGLYDQDGDILFYADDPRVKGIEYHSVSNFTKYDIGLDLERYLNHDNVFVFNDDGTLYDINSKNTKFNNGNLLTMDFNTIKHVIVVYSTRVPKRESISTLPRNKAFTKKLLAGKKTVEESIDLNILDRDFDFSNDRNKEYSINHDASEDYVWDTAHRKYAGLVHHIKNMNSHEFTKDELDQDSKGYVHIRRDMYFDYPHKTYPIVFLDGIADTDTNNHIDYDGHCFKFYTGNKNYEKCNILFFKNVINGKYDVKADANGIIDISATYIPPEEITILTDNGKNKFLYPLNHTLLDNKTIQLEDPSFANTKLYMCSKYQFIHERYIIDDNVLILSDKFETAYNKKKFMIFYNGLYVNEADYEILLPDLTVEAPLAALPGALNTYYYAAKSEIISGGKINKRAIYFNFKINKSDMPKDSNTYLFANNTQSIKKIIDVYYVSSIPGNRIEIMGDLIIDCVKVYAKEDHQITFKIPKPYKNFPLTYDTFFAINGTMYIKKDRYTIDSDDESITFVDPDNDYLLKGQSITFVYPRFKMDGELDDRIPSDNIVHFTYHSTKLDDDSSTVTFPTYTPGSSTEGVLLFINSTYVEPDRYTISGNTVTFLHEEIEAEYKLTLAVPNDITQNKKVTNNNITIKTGEAKVISDGQIEFDIPNNISHDNMFVFLNSMLLSENRYAISEDYKHIDVHHIEDKLVKGQKLLFVNLKNVNDNNSFTKDLNKMHVKCIHYGTRLKDDSASFKIPVEEFVHAKFKEFNFLVFLNGTWLEFDRYRVKNGEITLTNPLDILLKNRWIEIVVFYKDNDYESNYLGDGINPGEVIYWQEQCVEIEDENQFTYEIPYPNLPFMDTPFLVTIGSAFIPSYQYEISPDKKYITFTGYAVDKLYAGKHIIFEFIHNKEYSHISKHETHYELEDGQTEVQLESPFNTSVNLHRRAMVFMGNTYIDRDRYVIDDVNNVLKFGDTMYSITNRHLTVVFFYMGTAATKTVAWLPISGYIAIPSRYMDRMYTNETLLIFVNGKLVPQSWVLNITDSLFKITKSLTSRFDLCILNGAPKIKELAEKYKNYMTDKDYISRMISTIKVSSKYH